MRWIASTAWHWLIGAAMTLTPFTALIAMGWVQRRMAGSIARAWGGERLPAPQWFSSGGLVANAKAGVYVAMPLVLWLSPVWAIWIAAWSLGWENSFTKGYERAGLGPLAALSGVALFSILMTLLPIAEARFSVTRDWRAFTDIRMLWAIARAKPFWTLATALIFLMGGLAVAGLKILPLGIGNTLDTAKQASDVKLFYPALCASILFPLYLATRIAAARLYAHVIRNPSSDKILARMTAQERNAASHAPRRQIILTAPLRFIWSGALLAATFASWAAFAFTLYAAQFLAHDWAAWINHPLIQLPTVVSIFRSP